MGLDFVEIVMEVEDQFGIAFKLDELTNVRTVGDFIAVIRSRIAAAAVTPHPDLTELHRLQQLVREITGQIDLRIHPSTSLQETLTTEECRQFWQRLPEILGYTPPMLLVPREARLFLVGLIFFSLMSSLAYALMTDMLLLSYAVLLNSLLTIAALQLSSFVRSVPPVGWETYGDVTRQLVMTVVTVKDLRLLTDEAILDQLKPVFCGILRIDPCEVVPSALLVEDLGVG